MGMSDEERRKCVYHNLRKLADIHREWTQDYQLKRLSSFNQQKYQDIRDLLANLWPALFHSGERPEFWDLCLQVKLEPHFDPERDAKEKVHELPENFLDWATAPDKLVAHEGEEGIHLGYIWQAYDIIKDTLGVIRRYDDEWRNQRHELETLLNRLMGLFFGVFSTKDAFGKAHIVQQIFKHVYGELYHYPYRKESWDVITKLCEADCFHHEAGGMMREEWSTLVRWHKHLELTHFTAMRKYKVEDRYKFVPGNEKYLLARAEAFISLSRSMSNYEHIWKRCAEMIEKSRLKKHLPALLELREKAKAERLVQKAEVTERDDYRRSTETLKEYGYAANYFFYDLLDHPTPKAVKQPVVKKKK